MENYVETIRRKIGHDLLVLVGANVIIYNTHHKYLLQQRANGNWGLMGGLMEVGESLEETAIREVYEESGLTIESLMQLQTFSGTAFRFKLKNEDEIYVVTTLFLANQVSGEMAYDGNDETLNLKYFSYQDLPETLEDEYRKYIQYFEDSVLQDN
ncbi:NUDIX domain-containing protein [Lactococcus laudensis]|uniref:NUDIX domain-containing protein n=1 Tax=Pseudolactococcus laudensis TaxID=1494461 RepID=A0A7V8SK02_9LACT|nr:NUDIX domain-containing protein [Lactococcus laudensis]MBA0016917.1 NUDIX domain-containing protein [Lactococcus laudensis]MBW9281604.1 NUDIX domain-containing protein [Lactococcus laudensis]